MGSTFKQPGSTARVRLQCRALSHTPSSFRASIVAHASSCATGDSFQIWFSNSSATARDSNVSTLCTTIRLNDAVTFRTVNCPAPIVTRFVNVVATQRKTNAACALFAYTWNSYTGPTPGPAPSIDGMPFTPLCFSSASQCKAREFLIATRPGPATTVLVQV